MTFKIKDNQKGFTLLEFVVAVTILAVGILAMVGLQSTAIRSRTSAKWETAATTLAEQKLEALKSSGYSGLTNTSWSTAESITLTGLGTFSRIYQISDSVASYLKYIQVSVSWTNQQGVSKQVNLATYVSKKS